MSHTRLMALAAGLAALALVPSSASASASRAYVVDDGQRCSDAVRPADNGPGRPWCTVGHAVATAPAGATIRVRPGAYPPVALADVHRTRPVTVEGSGPRRPVIAGVTVERSDHARLRGLKLTTGVLVRDSHDVEVTANEMALTPRGAATESGVILDQVDHVGVRGNWIHGGRDGVNVLGTTIPSSALVIAGNRFERLGNDGVHVSRGDGVLIVGNRFDDVRRRDDVDPEAHSDGMQIMGPTRNVVIWGNRVTRGRGFLVMVTPRAIGAPGQGHQGLVIANNVLLGPDFGIRTFSTPGARIVNNTVWGTATSPHSGIDVYDRAGSANDGSPGVLLANNVVRRLDVDGAAGIARQAANLIVDGPRTALDLGGTPAFAAAAAGDLHLAAGSAGVDAADPELAPTLDAQGRERRSRPDVGAYENGGRPLPLGRLVRRLADIRSSA